MYGLYDNVLERIKICTYNLVTHEETLYENLVLPNDFDEFHKQDTNLLILFNNVYYATFTKNNEHGIFLMKSTDLINWKEIPDIHFSNIGTFQIINNNLVLNTEKNSYLINDSVTNLTYKVVGYYNNKYIAINNYKQIKTSGTIDFTNSELSHTLPSNYVFSIGMYECSDFIMIGDAIFDKDLSFLTYVDNMKFSYNNYVFYATDSYSAINGSSTLFYPLPIYLEKFDFDDYMIYDDITNKIYVRSETSALYNLNMIPQLLEVPINAS